MLFSLARAGRAAGMRRGLHPGMPLVKLAAAGSALAGGHFALAAPKIDEAAVLNKSYEQGLLPRELWLKELII